MLFTLGPVGWGDSQVERENRRNEVLQRRQAREIERMIAHEHQRGEINKKLSEKVGMLDERAKQQQRLKKQRDKEYQEKQCVILPLEDWTHLPLPAG